MAAPKRARSSRASKSCRAARSSIAAATIEEFDLDAALARKPKLIIVDELAHTNAPESRHPKRWQDVEELLAAGIDVWTALNIQHLESLADVVSRITGVVVRETVPGHRSAARRRRRAGRHHAGRTHPAPERRQGLSAGDGAAGEQNFFTPGNLTALRELALRRTADAGRRPDGRLSAPEGDRRSVGDVRAAARLRRADAAVGAGGAASEPARDRPQRGWIAVTVETSARQATPGTASRLTRRSASPSAWAAQSMRLQGRTTPRKSCASPGART